MNHFSLAIRYRPQSFAEVIGQDEIKKILSRASKEDKVAPAYLLSGTRGVGKTTIARIFAKALNCKQAPIDEPCNTCDQCKHITQGIHVDVVEIDGASNRGIDDARRLRESISYVPMEGRYKVFIIDEAHMLTRESFNALLKTLEEPPSYSTFIFATTEAHKFPITIVSRCQHFVFNPISETKIIQHVNHVLDIEQYQYNKDAVELIARRASGSVRDAMSLLSQVLMLSDQHLTSDIVRQVLGLADQEWYENFLVACSKQDYIAIVNLNYALHDRGIDIGFFLREFVVFWRNIFLLKQLGENAASIIGFSLEERQRLLCLSEKFSLSYVHAAWQMVLENQRQILMSLEPPVALELLFLNLVLLPKLLSLEDLSKLVIAPQHRIPEVKQQKVLVKKDESTLKQDKNSFFEEKKLLGLKQKKNIQIASLALEPTWEGFLKFCSQNSLSSLLYILKKIKGYFQDNILKIRTNSFFQYEELIANEKLNVLQEAVLLYTNDTYSVQIFEPEKIIKPEVELKKDFLSHPVIQVVQKSLDAELVRCIPINDTPVDV